MRAAPFDVFHLSETLDNTHPLVLLICAAVDDDLERLLRVRENKSGVLYFT